MGLLHLLLVALVASTAVGDDCGCVNKDQQINPISNPMIFFQQPTLGGVMNGVACAMNCTLTANAYDQTKDGLAIQILANGLGKAKITVVDGPRSFLITQNTVQSDITWHSSGGVLIFNFEGEVSPPGTFMIVVQTATRDILPSVLPTTAAPPTSPYDDLKYRKNPLLVANDIMIGIDLSSESINDLKQFAMDLISTLTITNATDCGAGTRLALHGLTNVDGFTGTYMPDWTYISESAIGNINSMFQISTGPFNIGPVNGFVENGFKDNQGPIQPDEPDRCLNRGRVYLLLTTQQPKEYQPSIPNNGPIVNFIERGVHPIIVSPLKNGSRNYYDQYMTMPANSKSYNRWSYFDIDKGVTEFINTFLVDTTPDLSCQLDNDYKITLENSVTSSTPVEVSIPPYYEGMKAEGDEDNWDSDWDTIKHYCNFQSTTVTIAQTDVPADITNKADVCLKVYYDLETDRDFVTINSGDPLAGNQKEVVKLTGRDVSGSTFRLGNTKGSINFSSDEKNVYDGFYAKIYPCGKDTS